MATPPTDAGGQADGSGSNGESEVWKLVARELHDRVAQTLTGMLIDVENFKTEQVGWEDVLRQLDTIQDSTRQVLQSLRQLLHDLRGEELTGFRLVDGLNSLAARLEAKTGLAVKVVVSDDWPVAIPAAQSMNLYRIVEEALTNVYRHSGASSASVVLEVLPGSMLAASITDFGRGYDTDLRRSGMGTRGMRERTVLLGGELNIAAEPGVGTTVRITFPKDRTAESPVETIDRLSEKLMKPEEIPA